MSPLRRIADCWELVRVGAPLSVGPTGELALALFHRWEPDCLFMILTFYGDEAGTDGSYPFVMVGGYVSTVAKWNDFDKRWRKLLKKNGLKRFHAMDFPKERPYRDWTEHQTTVFFAAMERLILKRTLFGVTVRLDVPDYQEHYWGPGPIKGLQLDSKYGVCVRFLMSFMDTMLTEHFGDDFRVNMLLEDGDKSIGAGDAHRVFKQLKTLIPECDRHFGTLAFDKKDRFPGLQAADATVSPAHRLERDGEPALTPFLDGETLEDGRREKGNAAPVYRLKIDGTILKEMRENVVAWKELRRAYWRDGATRRPPSETGA